jgi:HlyD family secretion protein
VRVIIAIAVTFVVTVVLAAGIGIWLASRAKAAASIVRLEKPARGDLTEFVSARAEVQPKTKVSISARVAARIVKLPYDEGARVTKGDPNATPPVPASVLVELDSKDLEAALRSAEARRDAQAAELEVSKARVAGAEAQCDGCRASLRQAERDYERQKTLLQTEDVSQADVDRVQRQAEELQAQLAGATHSLEAAKMTINVLQHNLEAADADIARARDALSYTTITSPIDGVVTRIYAEEGELVIPGTMNNPGTVIMTVADLSKMLLVAQVDETDVGRVKVGQHAKAKIHASLDEKFEGTVDTIALTHDIGTGGSKYYKTEVLLKLDGRSVYSGSTADVDIETDYNHDVLKLPSQAVLERPLDDLPGAVRDGNPNVDADKHYATVVYRYNGGKAVVTPVKIGPSDETHTVILGGLSEQDQVIVGPYKVLEALKHEQKVQDEREVPKAAPAGKPPAEQKAGDAPA